MPLLKKGRVLESDLTRERYIVESPCIDRGGFGEIYWGARLGQQGHPGDRVAIKVSTDALTWHGESYFGRLLEGLRDVVEQLDSFAIVDGTGGRRRTKYVLVLEWMDDGTVFQAVCGGKKKLPETESTVIRQIGELLEVLDLLHSHGICHGDITPKNVFFRSNHLALGDLGIAKQSLLGCPLELEGITPEMYSPLDASSESWTPSEDIYQLGLLALSLITGQEIWSDEVCGSVLKHLDASDHLKGWIRDATLKRGQRFVDAREALEALRSPSPKPTKRPSSLRGQTVVFTGKMSMTRDVARAKAERAGAHFQDQVNGATTLLVLGDQNVMQVGVKHSTKRYDALRLLRRGQQISFISESTFRRLIAKR